MSLSHNNYDVIETFCGVFLHVYFGPYTTRKHKTFPLFKISPKGLENVNDMRYYAIDYTNVLHKIGKLMLNDVKVTITDPILKEEPPSRTAAESFRTLDW